LECVGNMVGGGDGIDEGDFETEGWRDGCADVDGRAEDGVLLKDKVGDIVAAVVGASNGTAEGEGNVSEEFVSSADTA